jgi:hypothetical protein
VIDRLREQRRRVAGWAERHVLVIVLAIAFAVGVGIPAASRLEAIRRAEAVEEAATERRAQICDAIRASQDVDRALIDSVLEPSTGNPGASLLSPESFSALPPEVQRYLVELASDTPADEPGSTLADRLRTLRDEKLGDDDLPAYCLNPGATP